MCLTKLSYHFVTEQLANEFQGQFKCLQKNTKKYKAFPFPIEEKSENLVKMVMKML